MINGIKKDYGETFYDWKWYRFNKWKKNKEKTEEHRLGSEYTKLPENKKTFWKYTWSEYETKYPLPSRKYLNFWHTLQGFSFPKKTDGTRDIDLFHKYQKKLETFPEEDIKKNPEKYKMMIFQKGGVNEEGDDIDENEESEETYIVEDEDDVNIVMANVDHTKINNFILGDKHFCLYNYDFLPELFKSTNDVEINTLKQLSNIEFITSKDNLKKNTDIYRLLDYNLLTITNLIKYIDTHDNVYIKNTTNTLFYFVYGYISENKNSTYIPLEYFKNRNDKLHIKSDSLNIEKSYIETILNKDNIDKISNFIKELEESKIIINKFILHKLIFILSYIVNFIPQIKHNFNNFIKKIDNSKLFIKETFDIGTKENVNKTSLLETTLNSFEYITQLIFIKTHIMILLEKYKNNNNDNNIRKK